MKTKNIVLIIIIAAMFVACSKFEDGPAISFRSVCKRFTGKYRVAKITKNDTDLTDFWNQHYDLTFDFIQNDSDYPRSAKEMYVNVGGFIDSCGKWKGNWDFYPFTLEVNKNVSYKCHIYLLPQSFGKQGFYPLILDTSMHINEPIIFTVTRLKDTEMWVEHTKGNDTYEIHFKE